MKKRAAGRKKPFLMRLFGIRTKLIAAFLIPAALIVVLGVLSTQKASEAIIGSYEETIRNTIRKTGEYYDILFQMIDARSREIASDNDLRKYYDGSYASDPAMESDAYNKAVSKVKAAAQSDQNIGLACIIPSYGRGISTTGNIGADQYEKFAASGEGGRILDLKGEGYWSGSHDFVDSALGIRREQYGMSLSRQITGNRMQPVGVVVMDVSSDSIRGPLSTIELPEGSRCALITPDGREITPEGEPEQNVFSGTEFYARAAEDNSAEGFAELELDGEEYLYVHARVNTSGALINALVPLDAVTGQADGIRSLTFLVAVIAILIAIVVGILLTLDIGGIIGKMNRMVEKAADGDLTVKIRSRRKDEFSLLSRHMDEMFTNTKKVIRKSADVSSAILEASVNVADGSGAMVETARGISDVIAQMEQGLSQQAEDAKKCLDKMESLEQKIETVHAQTSQISEFSDKTREMVRAGMEAVGKLDENSRKTTEITGSVIEDIKSLEQESDAIEGIIGTINSIAEQTNLLSLNASIEAARAGEHGRGFAVVAGEIRNLAEGSLEASRQIKDIIGGIRRMTQETVVTARRAEEIVAVQGETITGVVDTFEQITEQVGGLTGNIEEITYGIKDIQDAKDVTLEAVTGITGVLEETAATAEQVQASAGQQVEASERLNAEAVRLREQSMELEDSISRFTVE